MPEILVVIPTLNEVDNLSRTVGRVRQHLPHSDVLVVDDNSQDGTTELADRLGAEDPGVTVVHRTIRGFASAIMDSFQYALKHGYKYVVTVDADGAYDLATLSELVETARTGNLDLVIGSRWVPGGDVKNMAARRRVTSWLGNTYTRRMLGTSVQDLTSTVRVYSSRILARIPFDKVRSEAYAFQIELVTRIAQAGGQIAELPIAYVERAIGKSKMRAKDMFAAGGRVTRWGLRGIRARPKPDA